MKYVLEVGKGKCNVFPDKYDKVIFDENTKELSFEEYKLIMNKLNSGYYPVWNSEKIIYEKIIEKIKYDIRKFDTSFYSRKMEAEGMLQDFDNYMEEIIVYDKQQRKIEHDKQLAYEEALKENPELTYEEFMSAQPMTLNFVEEPKPSQALQDFMKKYL